MMKSLHSLTQQIIIWRKKYSQSYLILRERLITGQLFSSKTKNTDLNRKSRNKRIKLRHSLLILVIAIFSLTSVVSYRFYRQPRLTVGTVSPVTIQAPRDGKFEDKVTTLEKIKEVKTGIIPILKQDREVTIGIKLELSKYLTTIEELRQLVEEFPFVDTKTISLENQQYLRSSKDSEFKILLKCAKDKQSTAILDNDTSTAEFNVALQHTLSQLKAYRQEASPEEFEALIVKITLIRYRYAQALKKIQQQPLFLLNEADITTILSLSDRDWQKN